MVLVLLYSPNPYATSSHPLFLMPPPMVSALVRFSMYPSFLLVCVMLVFPLTNLYLCVQKYPVVSYFDS